MPSAPLRSVYGVPSSVCHFTTPVSCLESVHPLTVGLVPGFSTSGTIHPISWRLNTSMLCDLSVAIRFQSP